MAMSATAVVAMMMVVVAVIVSTSFAVFATAAAAPFTCNHLQCACNFFFRSLANISDLAYEYE